jgi:hypothetical protein
VVRCQVRVGRKHDATAGTYRRGEREGYALNKADAECDGDSRSVTVDGDTRFNIQLARKKILCTGSVASS